MREDSDLAENTAYLQAVNDAAGPNVDLLALFPSYSSLKELEAELKRDGLLTFDRIFSEPVGYYFMKCMELWSQFVLLVSSIYCAWCFDLGYLISEFAVAKAIFLKDVDIYKTMRDPGARLKVSSFFSFSFRSAPLVLLMFFLSARLLASLLS